MERPKRRAAEVAAKSLAKCLEDLRESDKTGAEIIQEEARERLPEAERAYALYKKSPGARWLEAVKAGRELLPGRATAFKGCEICGAAAGSVELEFAHRVPRHITNPGDEVRHKVSHRVAQKLPASWGGPGVPFLRGWCF